MAARQSYQLSMQEQIGKCNSEQPPLDDETRTYQSQYVAQIKAKEKDPPVVDPLEEVELDGPEKFTFVSSLLSNEPGDTLIWLG